MGAAFDRWLAQPGTLHFLRRLVTRDPIHTSCRTPAIPASRAPRRYNSSVSNGETIRTEGRDERPDIEVHRPYIGQLQRGDQKKFDPLEMGLHMSLNSGVAIFDRDGDPSRAYAELTFQSEVHKMPGAKQRLVDKPEHRENYKLWVELLQFRQRVHGTSGVVQIWQGMRRRFIDLPVEGPEADILWKTFVNAGIVKMENKDVVPKVRIIKHAEELKARNGLQYQGLYKLVIGRQLRISPASVQYWHDQLATAGLTSPEDLASVVTDAAHASEAFLAFKAWLSLAEGRDKHEAYDIAIAEVLKLEDKRLAQHWHRLLLDNGYSPSTAMRQTAEVQTLLSGNHRPLPEIAPSVGQSVVLDQNLTADQPRFPQLTRASMNTIVGDVYGIKPKEISDSFCARLFATRAFSLDLVMKGLSFLSVDTLGPLAIREMAVRAGSPAEFNTRLDDLAQMKIKISASVYAQLIRKAARDNDLRLWTAVLETDQHPDVYEDAVTQEALVISFLQQQRLGQAHLSLTALNFTTETAKHRAWNRVLQHYILTRNYRALLDALQTIQSQGFPLTLYSLTLLHRYLLPDRRKGMRAKKQRGSPRWALDAVVSASIHTASRGHFVPISHWKELLKREGMFRRWRSLESLVLWLFQHYSVAYHQISRRSNRRAYLGGRRVRRQVLALRLIFAPVMLRAIVTWGFRTFSDHQTFREIDGVRTSHEVWARGLVLLRQIQGRNIFDVTAEARTSFQQRMWTLFGTGHSKRGTNRLARLHNKTSLAHYINHANEVWPGLVNWVSPELLREGKYSNPRLMVQFFGPLYRTGRKTREYGNVGLWAKHLGAAKRTHYLQPSHYQEKKRQWEQSPYRIVFDPDAPILEADESGHSTAQRVNDPPSTAVTPPDTTYEPMTPQERQSPSARSSNWRPPPSPRYIPAPP